MSVTESAHVPGSAARLIGFGDSNGWQKLIFPGFSIWFYGHLYDFADPRDAFRDWRPGLQASEVARFLDGLDGHYALVFEEPNRIIAAVDPVRSIPIFYSERNSGLLVAANSNALVDLGHVTLDAASALALAMSGYTIGTKTLFQELQQLGPGEYLLAEDGRGAQRLRYHRYSPWDVIEDSDASFEERLASTTLSLFERLIKQAENRLIAIPLSAGLDSRLLVSALAELGARNVICFSYGLPGNYEAVAAKKIARHLGYDWQFSPFSLSSQRRFLHGPVNARYQEFADSNCSTTVVHDLPAIVDLLDRKIIDERTIVINGNSGDYITGLHIQPPVSTGLAGLDHDSRINVIIATLIKKHFRLWRSLATKGNDSIVEAQLREEISLLDLPDLGEGQIHGIYEYLEFQDRQSKYVISRQRIYEFLGLEWRLPLWSRAYLDFWQAVPLRLKRGQSLYARMLQQRNWGGVWRGDEWKFPRRVSPGWMRYAVRPAAMAICAPFGKEGWHRFETHFLLYWMDLLCLQAGIPYSRVVLDRRGSRHAIAWLTEEYLRRKNLSWDGSPL
jgi:asparagine synthase (glutamine-hydrolysing)